MERANDAGADQFLDVLFALPKSNIANHITVTTQRAPISNNSGRSGEQQDAGHVVPSEQQVTWSGTARRSRRGPTSTGRARRSGSPELGP